MSPPTAIGVDDDLAASEAGVALGAADDELPRRVDVEVRVLPEERQRWLAGLQLDFLERLLDNPLHNELVHLFHARRRLVRPGISVNFLGPRGHAGIRVLRGNDDGVDFLRLYRAVRLHQVLDGDLGLPIRAQPPKLTALAHVCEFLAQARCYGVRQGHAVLRFVARVAEHDALVAGAHVEVLLPDVDSPRNVWALLVDAHQDLARLVAQPLALGAGEVVDVGVEADFRHDAADHLVVVDLGLGGDLACDHDHVVLRRGLASHLALRVLHEASVQDGIGDLVAEFVWVTLVHRLRRE
mmetsp:Transcript_48965/g.137069  ORF Transcript_48965/g.137069 Transcript_48965/m.137069 type:complete len:297 (-) Transcript_48965:132-1022(-)